MLAHLHIFANTDNMLQLIEDTKSNRHGHMYDALQATIFQWRAYASHISDHYSSNKCCAKCARGPCRGIAAAHGKLSSLHASTAEMIAFRPSGDSIAHYMLYLIVGHHVDKALGENEQ
jgi:hypothetical protein